MKSKKFTISHFGKICTASFIWQNEVGYWRSSKNKFKLLLCKPCSYHSVWYSVMWNFKLQFWGICLMICHAFLLWVLELGFNGRRFNFWRSSLTIEQKLHNHWHYHWVFGGLKSVVLLEMSYISCGLNYYGLREI